MLVALCAVAALFAAAEEAGAEPVRFDLNSGVINLGTDPGTNGVKIIDADSTPPDEPAVLRGDATGGTFTAPPSGFTFPPKTLDNVSGDLDADVEISASGSITGTFDTATGAADIDIPIQVAISVRSGASVLGRCVTNFDLGLATIGTLSDPGDPGATPPRPPADYQAAPFDPAAEGEGAMVATWPSIPATSGAGGSVPGVVCPEVDGLIGGPGGIWLAGTGGPDLGIFTVYPGGEGTTFATSQGGWTFSTAPSGACVPNVTCPALTGTHEATGGTGGDGDGFIRTTSAGLLALPTQLADNTAIWESPAFTYDGAEGEPAQTLSFSLAQRNAFENLLDLANVPYQVDLVSEGGSTTPLVASTEVEPLESWTPLAPVSLDPATLTIGSEYQIRISLQISPQVLALLPAGTFDYDDVALTASRPSPDPVDPVDPTDPTDPTEPTNPYQPPRDPNRPDVPGWPDGPNPPNNVTAIFDGKALYLRLKCPKKFKPRCSGKAHAVTAKGKRAKPMTASRGAGQRAGKWKVVKLAVKPKYRAKVGKLAQKPKARTLWVKQSVWAPKFRSGQKTLVWHKYKVRRAAK